MTIEQVQVRKFNNPFVSVGTEEGMNKLSSNPEIGSKQLLDLQNSLIADGKYDILSSLEYRERIDNVTKQYGKANQRRVKGDLVYSWLVDQENFIENRTGENKRNVVSGMPRWKFDKHRTAERTAAQMYTTFGKIAEFQITSDIKILHEIEQLELIHGSEGLLSLKKPSNLDEKSIQNSPIQQGRMFLLGIRGLSPTIAAQVVEYVKLPPNTSRSIIGKLPAAIIRMGARLGLDWSDKAHTGWPSIQDGGGVSLPHKDNQIVYESAVNVRIDHIKVCIANEWDLPNLKDYLPDEILRNRVIMRSLIKLRKEHRKNNPISRWSPPHVRGQDGVVYSHTGAVVRDTDQTKTIASEDVARKSREKKGMNAITRSLVVALLGFF